jgi:hypothetical protein
MWRQCVCGSWYWGAPQSDADDRLTEMLEGVRLQADSRAYYSPEESYKTGWNAALDYVQRLRTALADADSAAPAEPVMSVAMSDADEGPA